MTKKTFFTVLMMLAAMSGRAQSFDFDLTKTQPKYNEQDGYGYDLLPAPDEKQPKEPFYFSVRVPDGNNSNNTVISLNMLNILTRC